jgi:hypothetical protein
VEEHPSIPVHHEVYVLLISFLCNSGYFHLWISAGGEILCRPREVYGPELVSGSRDEGKAPLMDIIEETIHVRRVVVFFIGLHGKDLGAKGPR